MLAILPPAKPRRIPQGENHFRSKYQFPRTWNLLFRWFSLSLAGCFARGVLAHERFASKSESHLFASAASASKCKKNARECKRMQVECAYSSSFPPAAVSTGVESAFTGRFHGRLRATKGPAEQWSKKMQGIAVLLHYNPIRFP